MGLFLAMSGVIGGEEQPVVEALSAYAEDQQGSLKPEKLSTEDEECLVVAAGVGGVTVLYPAEFFDWESVSEYLSRRLGKPVFAFHIHDGDLWMYSLYDQGNFVDQFNPVPDYWQELGDAARQAWSGNAAEVARRVPGVTAEQIARYLVPWTEDVLAERSKAYPGDQFDYGTDWQLVDFMNKLGLDYPVDDRGETRGRTFRFRC